MATTRDMFDLKGKVALVTGGSRGLGLQIAEGLGDMGCKVAITARKADELAEAKQHLSARGIDAHTIVNDLSKLDAIPAMVDEVLKRYGAIDILVNNAGATWGAPAEDYPDEAWRKVMTLNIDAMFFLSREVAKKSMIPRRAGKIVNVASIAGLYGGSPDMHTIAYNTSKGAAVNFTRALASEWGGYNINVNAVCPGFFPTKMARGILERVGQRVIDGTPLKRMGGDEDLKGVVVFLASEAARHVSGQCIAVDGGFSIA
jgi:NAD(P)-dependent dehydrogenase (short-subunit alcohol dehydrogenase family)